MTRRRWKHRFRLLDATFARWDRTRRWRSYRVDRSTCCPRCFHANFYSARRYFRCRTHLRAPLPSRDLSTQQQFVILLSLSPSLKFSLSVWQHYATSLNTRLFSGRETLLQCLFPHKIILFQNEWRSADQWAGNVDCRHASISGD